ncbi:condensation domain-containing protein [Streptomyces sp. NRRL F-5123]|uniref:condensation domain-containing protein n=1 Tax=Streptomyces sp. NRRL F-5123 TaxID=1463856 RepID=UPI0004E0D21E|nr:condensation domain-containing protein [Streptomyces sp. NRRL F-5123]
MTADAGVPGIRPRHRTIDVHALPAPGPAEGPLTWAQQHMLTLFEELHPQTDPLNLRFAAKLRPGLTEDEVLDALADLVRTYDTLRTRYAVTPDGPVQRVSAAVRLRVAVHDCPAEAGETLATQVLAEAAARPFDIGAEWPVRAAIVVVDGAPRHLLLALCHLAVDHEGAEWMRHHLRALLPPQPARAPVPATPYRMLGEAERERTAAGVRGGVRAVAHHERTFAAMPQTMLPRALAEAEPPRYRYLEFHSPALALALPALAARHNSSPATVLFAGLAAVSGFVAGLPRAFLQLTVGNRARARLHGAVGMFTQDVPVAVDLTDATVADVIGRATPAVFQAARFGAYPPADLAAARRAAELRRGVAFDLSCWLNYRTSAEHTAPATGRPTAAELDRAAARTRWRWLDGTDNSTSTYFVFADSRPRRVTLTTILDTALLPAAEAVEWLRAVERVLCASLGGDVAVAAIGERTGLAPDPRGDGWFLSDAGWAHLPTVTDLVRRTSAAEHAAVLAEPSAEGPRLVAYLQGARTPPDPAALHAACTAALPGLRTAVAPHEYVVCAGPPPRSPDPAAWRRAPVLARGTGRSSTLPEPHPA